MSYLGLDIGTGSCKTVAFDGEGKALASAFREYPVIHPESHMAEIDSTQVISGCFDAIREVNRQLSDPVAAMSVSSQGEAFTPVDAGGGVLANAMTSSDLRALEMVPYMNGIAGEDTLYRITGHTPHPIFTLYKLLWLKKNKPYIWQKASYFLCFEDLFQYKVGVKPHISWPLAGRTMLFDVRKHRWSDDILSVVGLDSSRLAEPIAPGEIVGIIRKKAGAALGFRQDVLLVSGGHDQTCAALGAGVTGPGLCMYATGSVECFCPMLERPAFTEALRKNNLCCYDFTVKGKYTTVAYSLTGGNILRWVRDELGYEERVLARASGGNAYSRLLEKMPEDPTDLLVLPYFSGSGTPYFNPHATGAIVGLRQNTGKGEMIKALLEGVALEMKLNLKLMEESGMYIDTMIATGGGTRSDRWTQLKADVLGKKVIVRNVDEAGCYGASLLARSAAEGIEVQELIRNDPSGDREFLPRTGHADAYHKKFEAYNRLYAALKPIWEP